MNSPYALGPLAHRTALETPGAVRIEPCPPAGLLVLRAEHAEAAPALRPSLETDLPAATGRAFETALGHVMALGPDEWLLIGPDEDCASTMAMLETALSGRHFQLVDVSDYYTGVDLTGPEARNLLSKLMVIDLHLRAFSAGRAVSSVLAKAGVWLWMTSDEEMPAGPAFRIIVRRSLADYVWSLLAEAGREWGLLGQAPLGQVRLHLPHFS